MAALAEAIPTHPPAHSDGEVIEALAIAKEALRRIDPTATLRLGDAARSRLLACDHPYTKNIADWLGVQIPSSLETQQNVEDVYATLGLTQAIRTELPMHLAARLLNEGPAVMPRIPLTLSLDHNLEEHVGVAVLPEDALVAFAMRTAYLLQAIENNGVEAIVDRHLENWVPGNTLANRSRDCARDRLRNRGRS